MKAPLAIFYHCLLGLGDRSDFSHTAFKIVAEQMDALKVSGLLAESSHFCVGINGGHESLIAANAIIPEKAQIVMHGLQCHNECRTIRMIEQWLPGHED